MDVDWQLVDTGQRTVFKWDAGMLLIMLLQIIPNFITYNSCSQISALDWINWTYKLQNSVYCVQVQNCKCLAFLDN
jgi:hypothetical protein